MKDIIQVTGRILVRIFLAIGIFILIAPFLITILIIGLFFIEFTPSYSYPEWKEDAQNIFDEMFGRECEGLRETDYITRGPYDSGYRSVDLEFEKLPEGMDLTVGAETYDDDSTLGSRNDTLIDFYDSDKGTKQNLFFRYNARLNLLEYSNTTQVGTSISWERMKEVEDNFYFIVNKILIERWLGNKKSQFTRDDLGEFKLVNDIPYAYAGLADSKPMEEIVVEKVQPGEEGIVYSVWLDNDSLLCVQQDNCFRTKNKESGQLCNLEDLLILNDDFYLWLKTSGQATGNLERIPESREKGMENTQLMLQNCPVEEMEKMLPACEFYLEPGYLHIHFPYWKWESENEGWERNGDELWRGWLNLKTEDIEGFLKVEKW